MNKTTARSEIQRAYRLLSDAASILAAVNEKADESAADEAWAAGLVQDATLVLAGDLHDAAAGEPITRRVSLHAIGIPDGEDSGGGFGHRALQALAVCREAWANADNSNAPRLERAMGWICRAWLGTKGYESAHVVRAILTHRLGTETGRTIVARVQSAMAEDQEAAEILRRLGRPLALVEGGAST